MSTESGRPTTGGEHMRTQDRYDAATRFDVADVVALLRAAAAEEPFLSPSERRDALLRLFDDEVATAIA